MAKIRVFILNSNGKIELSKEELQQMLDESYRDGHNSVTITTPSYPYNPLTPYYATGYDSNTVTSTTVTVTKNNEN